MPETEESKGKTLFRRWKGERFSEHRVKRVKGLFTQAVIWLGLLAVLETLYMMYVLWVV
ncbi:TPA: hypothetical protein G8O10_003203 [Salmonella enterica]|nr:hypothetical protein [Salmonella enterica]